MKQLIILLSLMCFFANLNITEAKQKSKSANVIHKKHSAKRSIASKKKKLIHKKQKHAIHKNIQNKIEPAAHHNKPDDMNSANDLSDEFIKNRPAQASNYAE